MLPYGRQEVTDSDIAAVEAVLRSDFLTQGPAVPAFERAVASRVGAAHAVALSSATAALHVACLALGVGPGDVVWTVPNTFVASANCALYCGASVDFVDIDADTWNLSVDRLREKLAEAARTGRLPKVVIPVHFSGQATDQEAIWELATQYGFRIIEDASHGIGASHGGEPVGSCRWSHITIFSFHPVKIITTAEGGLALTNDDELATRMALFRTHGITRDVAHFVGDDSADPPAFYYEQQLLGYNYRMTDLHAALGASQLGRLDAYLTRRNEIARRYDQLLAGYPLQLPTVAAVNHSAFHIYVVRVKTGGAAARRRVFDRMRRSGIGVNVHYAPVHLQPYYRALGFRPGQFPEAERHGETAITLPIFPAMSDKDQDAVCTALRAALG
jgi:UDP-4-amino-4,6-dideoxy-N-acetyl-beta-L-altrosamine transaminase